MEKVSIIEVTACADHVHMLVAILPNLSVSSFMGSLKEKTLWGAWCLGEGFCNLP